MSASKIAVVKSDSSELVAEFLAKGGTVKVISLRKPRQRKNPVAVAEIDMSVVPVQLRKYLKIG